MTTSTPEAKGASVRTCAGCREALAADELVRFVAFEGTPSVLVPDLRHKLPGRGVYAHPRRFCLEAAVRGGFQKSLRQPMSFGRPGETGTAGLIELLGDQYRTRAEGLLLSASRISRLVVGTDAVRDALEAGRVQLVVFATDAAGRREDIQSEAQARDVPVAVFTAKQELGRLFRRDEVGVLCVLDAGIAREILDSVSARNVLLEDR